MQIRFAVLLVTIWGCGSSHPPAAAQDGVAPPAAPVPESPQQVDNEPCQALSLRSCTHSWFDASGGHHCNSSWQFCKKDGSSWLPCADWNPGPTGEPEYPDHP